MEMQLVHFKQAFDDFDRDKTGTIDKKEFHLVLESLGIYTDTNKLIALFDATDTNEDDIIDFGEFLIFLLNRNKPPSAVLAAIKKRKH